MPLSLEKDLVEQTDDYAVNHGITFSDVVSDAVCAVCWKKSAKFSWSLDCDASAWSCPFPGELRRAGHENSAWMQV